MPDMSSCSTEFGSILPSLSVYSKQLIGGVAIQSLDKSKTRSKLHRFYVDEVLEGKSYFAINWKGEVERIVPIIVLRLSHPDGRILVQLGEWDGERIHVACKLMGKKQKEGETPDQTRVRLLSGMLAPLSF